MPKYPRTAAVLGSGVMGGAIAAHLANAGLRVLLLDIVPEAPAERELVAGPGPGDRAFRDRLAAASKVALARARPPALYVPDLAHRIAVGNLEDDLPRLSEVDWIVEVVKEDLSIKRELFEKVAAHRTPGTLVSSNTSGLSIAAMANGRDDDFRRHFLGTHFFNPPRYLHLLEIVPGPDTDPEVVSAMADFADRELGKGVVIARDTPNFIANRLGVFAVLEAVRATRELGLTVEEVDALTGPLLGRPKSATYRTADLVGLDTLAAVAENVRRNCPEDERRGRFEPPEVVTRLVEAGRLGEKAGGGFYRRSRGADGSRRLEAVDFETLDYRPVVTPEFPELAEVARIPDTARRLRAAFESGGRAAAFLERALLPVLAYAARRIGEVTDRTDAIDAAMRWGFGWEMGPFETWDALGFAAVAERLDARGESLPEWIGAMRRERRPGFYRLEGGHLFVRGPKSVEARPVPEMPGKPNLERLRSAGATVVENDAAAMVDLGDGVACLEFRSKRNVIGLDTVEMIHRALRECERGFAGLVVGNQGPAFCAGADLSLVLREAEAGRWDEIDRLVRGFQDAVLALKYAAIPVVVAPHDRCLGGGAEIVLHGPVVQASAESYIGLVEVGAGLLPAGGGCKEMLVRNLARDLGDDAPVEALKRAFETIGLAKVSASALDARAIGFIGTVDRITINPDRVLGDAKARVLELAHVGYRPLEPPRAIAVTGRAGRAVIDVMTFNLLEARRISAHDRKIGGHVAHVLSGGDLPGPSRVSERHLLDLEREAFLALAGEPLTRDRMRHLLERGKPLRN